MSSSQPTLGLSMVKPKSTNTLADIVMIHGLRGNNRQSWCKDGKDGLFWPLWLAEENPFRVFTFGYNATPSNPIVPLDTIDIALDLLLKLSINGVGKQSPIIFIAHDLGGTVAKLVYRLAHHDPKYQNVFSKITTMIFLGTAHRGAEFYNAEKLKRYLERFIPNSAHIKVESDYFRQYAPGLKLCSFYESLPVGQVLVPKSTAVLGIRNERNEMFNANHDDMCRFSSQKDPNYLKVLKVLELSVNGARGSQWDPSSK